MARDLSGVLDAVLAGIVVLDSAGNVELVNAAGCRILGTSAETVLGLPVERLQGADHAVAKLARTVLDTGGSLVEGELPIHGRGEGHLVVEVSAAPLFDREDGSRGGVVLVLRDRTIENSLRQLVADRESLSAFGRIAAGIAHEVKNPLGGIRGAAEILSARSSDAKSRDAAELIVREVDRIAGLVDDLMVFTRGEDVRFVPLNIHRVLDGVIDLLAMDPIGSGVAVKREFDPSLPELMGDADRLTQVFHNIVRNALEAMDGCDGELVIKTRMAFDPRVGTEPDGSVPEDVWFVIKETTGVGDFIGSEGKPSAMGLVDIEKMLAATLVPEESAALANLSFKKGDKVKVREGPFENFEGVVDEINSQKGTVRVIVTIFGRLTPIEIEYWQVESL